MRTARTAVETLRRAAEKAERLAGVATPGPWRKRHGFPAYVSAPSEGVTILAVTKDLDEEDAEHIAAWHPGVAKAFAAVWREHADLDECHMLADCAVLAAAATFLGEDA